MIAVEFKYGEFTADQVTSTLLKLRKKIFFLLLYVDPNTNEQYAEIDVNGAFENLLYELAGMNSLFQNPPELVTVCNLLEAARLEYFSDDFDFKVYRKLILDSGVEIMKIGGV